MVIHPSIICIGDWRDITRTEIKLAVEKKRSCNILVALWNISEEISETRVGSWIKKTLIMLRHAPQTPRV